MTIVLADADVHFRERLKKRLERIADMHVVGESLDSEETTAMILNRKPDIAILNSLLGDGRVIEVLTHVKRLMVPPTTIVVSDDPTHEDRIAYSLAGADFIFAKATQEHQIIDTVRFLASHSRIEAANSPLARLDD